MGTSTANGGTSGSGTPLIPSWLDEATSPDQTAISTGLEHKPVQPLPPIPQAAEANRYTAPRAAFSKFARSGGASRGSLGSAVSGYVSRSSGGAKGAAQRMGASRATGGRLLNFLNNVVDRGVEEVLKSLNLENLTGQPVGEIFKGLADYICPEGGSVDVGIARAGFFEMIDDLNESGISDLDNLNTEQVQTIFEMFTARTIEDRIYNEIGTKAITLPQDMAALDNVQAQLHDFVSNGVADALSNMQGDFHDSPKGKMPEFVENVYEKAFAVLAALGEAEEDKEKV